MAVFLRPIIRLLSAWRIAPFLLVFAALPAGAQTAQTAREMPSSQAAREMEAASAPKPAPPLVRRRPSIEERRSFEEVMKTIRPTRQGCFEAHFPNRQWIEKPCEAAPKMPSPHAKGPRPNNVGAGTGRFAVVTSGNISQSTGSFDSVSGVAQIDGFIGGSTTTVHPNVYELQLNANQFTTTIGGCNKITSCLGWEQFLMSQSQCTGGPCVFIEYWLLNYPQPCPTNASWSYYNGSVPNTIPGCYLNTTAATLPAISVADLGSVTMNAAVSGGNDTVTISDATGTLGLKTNASIAGLGSGWTGVEYGIYGDCCSAETFFTASTTASLTVRVAVTNGTTNAPTCATNFTGITAETNNLNLTGGCSTVGGASPAIVYTMTGGGSLPPGVSVGDPHLTTFHGAHYDFQHAGEYILAKADPDFEVQVRQILITPPGKPAIAVNNGAAIQMGPDKFVVLLNGVQVNGRMMTFPNGQTIRLNGDVLVDHRNNVYTISRTLGDIVHVTTYSDHVDVSVTIGATNVASVRGLLVGGDEQKPFMRRDKTTIRGLMTPVVLRDFVESWRVEPSDSLFGDEGRPHPAAPLEQMTAAKLDPAKAAKARQTCVARGVKAGTALEDCVLDVAVLGKPEAANGFVFAPRVKILIRDH